jgi:hypothetical protein
MWCLISSENKCLSIREVVNRIDVSDVFGVRCQQGFCEENEAPDISSAAFAFTRSFECTGSGGGAGGDAVEYRTHMYWVRNLIIQPRC